jgi:hypothetical protein
MEGSLKQGRIDFSSAFVKLQHKRVENPNDGKLFIQWKFEE